MPSSATSSGLQDGCLLVPEPFCDLSTTIKEEPLLQVLDWARVARVDSYVVMEEPESTDNVTFDQIVGAELLRNLPVQGYRLRNPLVLTVHRARDYYWVAPERFVLHGVGDTPQAAIEDYAYALLDYYEDLRRLREVLASHLLEHLEFLATLIVRE